MITYDYKCPSCSIGFSRTYKKFPKKRTAKCPKCSKQCKKVIALPGAIVYKGKGFYKTDKEGS